MLRRRLGLGRRLGRLKALTQLHLRLYGACVGARGAAALGLGLAELPALTDLQLWLSVAG